MNFPARTLILQRKNHDGEGKECGPHKGRGGGLNPGLRVLRSKGALLGICLSAAEY